MSKRKQKRKPKAKSFAPTDQVVCHYELYHGVYDERFVVPSGEGFSKLVALRRRGRFIYIHPDFLS